MSGLGDDSGYAPRPGDVETIASGEPDYDPDDRSGPLGLGRPPADDSRVKIRLHGHPATYVVRVTTSREHGPQLTELAVTADDGAVLTPDAVAAIPVRRLAAAAAQWIEQWGGRVMFVGDMAETTARPDLDRDGKLPKVYRAAQIAERALALGLPVRPTVAAELVVSKSTVDRLLKRAKSEGWLDDTPLPKQPPASPSRRPLRSPATEGN